MCIDIIPPLCSPMSPGMASDEDLRATDLEGTQQKPMNHHRYMGFCKGNHPQDSPHPPGINGILMGKL